jgi:hypothetical protein
VNEDERKRGQVQRHTGLMQMRCSTHIVGVREIRQGVLAPNSGGSHCNSSSLERNRSSGGSADESDHLATNVFILFFPGEL